MIYRYLEDLEREAAKAEKPMRVAVAGSADESVLEAVFEAANRNIVSPILIGNKDEIARKSENIPADAAAAIAGLPVIAADGPEDCGEAAVAAVRDGAADFIMKGNMETSDVLKPLVRKENGLNTGRTMNVLAYNEVPCLPRMLGLSDGGMIPYPTFEQKKDILENCVGMLRALGIERPQVAVLAGIEHVNPKMPETVDAARLQEMNRAGEITDCDVYGPISIDIALSAEIAAHKGYDCPSCGNFDLVIVPSLVAGNLMNKAMIITGGAKMAGVVLGAKVPVVLSSRGASPEEKFGSLALAALAARKNGSDLMEPEGK